MENYNILIGLGKALIFDEYEKIMLTPESKATAHAGGIICDKGILEKFILSGGKTQGENYPSEAELMRDYIYENISKNVADFITLESNSMTTWGNARNVKRILENEINKDAGLLTIGYHLPRAIKIFEIEGFSNLAPLASENYLQESYSTEISDYLKSFKGVSEQTKELMVRTFTFFFPDGKILESIANKTRGD